ncbi:MAG: bacillithiol system redox-active protein YtxJ [Bacteroidota bacterium]|nr:bacillithiol system redox-active protein YtxJ [Bacteroidota bacterium]
MKWLQLNDISQLDLISKESSLPEIQSVLIFKHSTRCSISNMSHGRLERSWKDNPAIPVYYLDLLNHRDISDEIASRFDVQHESPQALLIKDGKCIYHSSHSDISSADLIAAAAKS